MLLELRPFPFIPKRCAMDDPIQEWAAVTACHSLYGPGDTDKLALPGVGRGAHCGIAMAAQIQKCQVRGEIRVRHTAGPICVAGSLIFQAGSDAMPE